MELECVVRRNLYFVKRLLWYGWPVQRAVYKSYWRLLLRAAQNLQKRITLMKENPDGVLSRPGCPLMPIAMRGPELLSTLACKLMDATKALFMTGAPFDFFARDLFRVLSEILEDRKRALSCDASDGDGAGGPVRPKRRILLARYRWRGNPKEKELLAQAAADESEQLQLLPVPVNALPTRLRVTKTCELSRNLYGVCHGTGHLNPELKQAMMEYVDNNLSWVRHLQATRVHRLQDLSVFAIRERLGWGLLDKLQHVDLPPVLKAQVLREDYLDIRVSIEELGFDFVQNGSGDSAHQTPAFSRLPEQHQQQLKQPMMLPPQPSLDQEVGVDKLFGQFLFNRLDFWYRQQKQGDRASGVTPDAAAASPQSPSDQQDDADDVAYDTLLLKL